MFRARLLILPAVLSATVAFANVKPSDAVLQEKLGALLSPSIVLTDEDGRSIRLQELHRNVPAILFLSWYHCPNLCNLTADGLIETIRRSRLKIGTDFQVLQVSIDPKDGPKTSQAKMRTTWAKLGKATKGWRFLTAPKASIDQIAQTVGFGYRYEEASRQFAHPAGLVVLTPQGRVSAYFGGIRFPADDFDHAIRVASRNSIGEKVAQFFLSCFHFDPNANSKTGSILSVLRMSGALGALLLASLLITLVRTSV